MIFFSLKGKMMKMLRIILGSCYLLSLKNIKSSVSSFLLLFDLVFQRFQGFTPPRKNPFSFLPLHLLLSFCFRLFLKDFCLSTPTNFLKNSVKTLRQKKINKIKEFKKNGQSLFGLNFVAVSYHFWDFVNQYL